MKRISAAGTVSGVGRGPGAGDVAAGAMVPARPRAVAVVLVALTLLSRGAGAEDSAELPAPVTRTVDYATEVRPILEAHCVRCHGGAKRKGGFRVDRRTEALKGGDNLGEAIRPGQSAESPLIRLVAGVVPDLVMPPEGERLSAGEVGVLRAWIDQGAAWPADEPREEGTPHWAFQPVKRPAVPQPRQADWVRNPIDAFILDRLEREGLAPSPPAPPRVLARRAHFDLTGLPPAPETVSAFASDREPAAWAAMVEALLGSPRYGERWARHWLDVVRYAETHGFEMNQPRPNAWPYRDYVIRAFNEDRPYDRFVQEQIAGDALGVDEATGFLVAGAWDQVKSPDVVLTSNQRADELHDIVSTTGTAFLGLTIGCARCHEHKFDPVPQRDYYAIKAVFEGVEHGERPLDSGDSAARRRAAEDEREALARLDDALAAFAPPVPPGRTVILDDAAPEPTEPSGARVRELVPSEAKGEYAAGTGRGELSETGEAGRLPTLTRGYRAWRGVANRDVFTWEPGVAGRFRVFLSWGAGWATHATDARYVLDQDGDPGTTGDRREIARVDQQRFAGGDGDVPGRPRWSGFLEAGVHEFSPESALVLRGGGSDAWVTADVIVLQEAGDAGEWTSAGPRLRPAVAAGSNVERFEPVRARRLRFEILATNGGEPCLDELEVFGPGPSAANLALSSAGASVSASGTFPNNPLHRLEHVNDGRYGNSRSWISDQPGRGWVEVAFARPVELARVVWGRDREGRFADRLATRYRIRVDPGSGEWKEVASSDDRIPALPGRMTPASAAAFVAGRDDPEARARLEGLLAERSKRAARLKELLEEPVAYVGRFNQPGVTRRFHRGDPMQPREEVAPGAISALAPRLELRPAGGGTNVVEGDRRLAFARWLASPENPLTARVMVNRIWMHHFGEGLVSTPSDFGANGAAPSHPELLDWLAAEFVASGWSVKNLHRLILHSATYRQASEVRPEGLRADAGSRWLWRFPPRRLEAEAIRDAILAVSGNLDLRAGGPGWSAFEPNENYVRVYTPRQVFGPSEWRRMIFATNVRQRPDGVFGVFDCPDGGQIAPKRTRSTTPLQALNLLNSGFLLQQAGVFADRVEREAGGHLGARVRQAFALAFQREPDPVEREAAVRFAGDHGLALLCRALLNANEFVFLD